MKQREGFTLVEISIVLVVIGLMVGGILVAQSMIESAKIHAQIKQFHQLDVMTRNFATKYQQIPGDIDRDGWLEDGYFPHTVDQPCYGVEFGGIGECGSFFADLSIREGLPGDFKAREALPEEVAASDSVFGEGKAAPLAKIGRGGLFAAQAYDRSVWWIIAAPSSTTGTPNGKSIDAFTPAQAQALDTKLDDGLGRSGNIAITGADYTGNIGQLRTYPGVCTTHMGGFDPERCPGAGYALYFSYINGSLCTTGATGIYTVNQKLPICGLQIKSGSY